MERTQVQYQVLRATVDMSVSQHPQTKRHGGSPEHSGKSSQRWYEPTLVLERTGQGANHQLQQHNQGFRVPCQELCPLLSPLQRQLRKWGLGRQCRCHRRSLRPSCQLCSALQHTGKACPHNEDPANAKKDVSATCSRVQTCNGAVQPFPAF